MNIKPIETSYRGYRFRSRLEARWAVFFDTLGVPWEYEAEGYHTPAGPYLPDFVLHLTNRTVFFEVKADDFQPQDDRWALVAREKGWDMIVARGIPGPDDFGTGPTNQQLEVYFAYGGWDNYQAFCVCSSCGAVGIEFSGRSERIPCTHENLDDHLDGSGHPRILAAYRAARSARFEHGQHGPS